MNLIIFFRIILEISLAYVLICGINKTMKKLKLKLFILGLLVATPSFLLAQINIQINSFNQYYFNTKECLNFSAINLGLKSVEVQFNFKIDNADNTKIVEFKTSPVILNPGVNLINSMTIGFKDIKYFNNDIYEIETKTGTFPSGNYKVCIWSVCSLPDCAGLGSGAGSTEQAECIQIQVENPTPLLLSYPENNSEIEEIRPVYNWIPPAPIASSSELNYLMRLVEVNEGQTPSDALMLNRPLIEIEGLVQNTMMHPNDINPLEPGKTYAWQVQAFIGKTYFAKSEQWKFKVKKDTLDLKKVPRNISYVEITGQTGNSMYYAVDYLKIKNEVRFKTGTILLNFKDKNGSILKIDQSSFIIKPGDNRLDIDLKNELKFKHGEIYELTGYLLTGELFIIKFTYIDSNLLPND